MNSCILCGCTCLKAVSWHSHQMCVVIWEDVMCGTISRVINKMQSSAPKVRLLGEWAQLLIWVGMTREHIPPPGRCHCNEIINIIITAIGFDVVSDVVSYMWCGAHMLILFISHFVFDIFYYYSLGHGSLAFCLNLKVKTFSLSVSLLSLAQSWVLIWVMCMFCGCLVKSIVPYWLFLAIYVFLHMTAYVYLEQRYQR